MSSIRNTVQLFGNLGRDPEAREFESGRKLGKVSIATSDVFRNAAGEFERRTQWHNLAAWGPQADYLMKYLHKGSFIGVRGRLNHRNYDDQNGNHKTYSEVIVDEFISFKQRGKSLPF
jgi:single-strand DNA-binding protein